MPKHDMRQEFVTKDELRQKLREHNVESLGQVKGVCLEPDGAFSVITRLD
jgi:uncharacterized membrane protein YcaP (DUF421 family)